MIAYLCGSDLCVVDANTRIAHRLSRGESVWGYFAWSPDGKRLVYGCGGATASRYSLCVTDLAARHVLRLTNTRGFMGDEVSWSPRGLLGFGCDPGICLMREDGTGSRVLVHGRDLGAPAWAPSGRVAAFGNGEVWTVRSDGTQRRRLTHGYGDGVAAWSPDGARIAFLRLGHGVGGLYVMNADGADQTRITT